MKLFKLFSILSFTLLLSINIFGQAAVDIPFTATINNYNFSLSVGLDLTATDCIDPQLGESNAPLPGPGETQIRFDLQPYECPGLSTFKDYRSPGFPPVFPFTGLIEHTLWFFVATGLQIEIAYNLPSNVQMSITDQIGGTFLNLGPFSGQGTLTIPGTYTAIFGRALLIMEYENIIPVELTSFSASVLQNEKAIQLNWTTGTETNNSGFEIQRTSPLPSPYQGEGGKAGRGWEKIGFVPGFGTTTELKSYSFIDENVSTGTYKYRLKQIDFDGSFKYSNEIEVNVDFTPKEFVLDQNYPNPFNPSTKIKYEIPSVTLRQAQSDIMVSLKVYDLLGNEVATLVNEEKQPGVYEVEFSVGQSATGGSSPDIASGIYFYQLKAEGFIQTRKMALTK